MIYLVAVLLCFGVIACGDGESTATQPVNQSNATTTGAGQSVATTATPANDAPDADTTAETPVSSASTQQAATNSEPGATATPLTLPTPRPIVQTSPPVRMRIPALGIDTAVQWVGVDAEGRMDVPSNYTEVAWYERGPSPGTPGNSVIAGHLDSTTGPAVFYRLEDLQPGDEIITSTQDGQEYRFVVTTSEVYDAVDAPLDRIFGNAIRPQLNLITCDGAFDQSQRQYDKRLVVYSVLAPGA